MAILEAKLSYTEKERYIERKRIQVWLDEAMKKKSAHLLYGCVGMGKTATILHYVQNNYSKYVYLNLDSYDNDIEEFQVYFREMINRLGYPEKAVPKVREFINWVEQQKESPVLIFDSIQSITNKEVYEIFDQLIRYGGHSCKLFFLCDFELSDFWKEKVMSTRLNLLYVDEICFQENEMSTYCRENHLDLTKNQQVIYQKKTGGWPALLHSEKNLYSIPSKNKRKNLDMHSLGLREYVYYNIWKYLNEAQRKLLQIIYTLPYVNEDLLFFMDGIREYSRELLWLRCQGLIQYDYIQEIYRVNDMIANYISMEADQNIRIPQDLSGRIMEWYEKQGLIQYIYLMQCKEKNVVKIKGIIKKYLRTLAATLNYEQIRMGLEILAEHRKKERLSARDSATAEYSTENEIIVWAEELEILFLKAKTVIYEEEYSVLDAIIKTFRRICGHLDGKKHQRAAELLLNIYYTDPRITMDEWLDLGEKILKKDETIEVYNMTGAGVSICFGLKEWVPFYMSGIKIQNQYQKRYNRIVCEEQRESFYTAEAEYFLVTSREKKALEYIQRSMNKMSVIKDTDRCVSIFSVLCNLYSKDIGREIYVENEKRLLSKLMGTTSLLQFMSVLSYSEYYTKYKENREYIGRWISENVKKERMVIDMENNTLFRIHGKILMITGQYQNALNLFEMLETYNKKRNNTFYTVEFQCAQAVSSFGMDKRTDSLKMISEATILAAKYHYVSPLCEYGKVGYDLLLMYQSFHAQDKQYVQYGKKQYFYGNIIRASYEEYESILLREAKKSLKDELYVPRQPRDKLTDTEEMVMNQVERGLSNQEIADALNIKITTVKSHLSSIYRKLGVKNRQSALKAIK